MASRKDERKAARLTEREAAAVPLLAYLGVAKVWTGEEVAEKRERDQRGAEAHLAAIQAKGDRQVAEWIVELSAAVGAMVLRDYLDRYRAGQPGYVSVWMALAGARARLARGETLAETTWPEPGLQLAAVPPADRVLAILRGLPQGGSVSQICDQLSACLGGKFTVLAVARVLGDLAKASLARVRVGRGGWEAVSY